MNQGEVVVTLSVDGKKLTAGLKTAEGQVKSFTKTIGDDTTAATRKADDAFAAFASKAKVALLGATAAAAVGFGAALKSSAKYESSLSRLEQASGATGNQMKAMAALTRQLGADTNLAGVTASDAAATMTELSKAGLSVKDTMDASRGVMSLAKAGNMEFAEAATLAASALNAFQLQGKDAGKVADALAAGANASQANLADLGTGLQQSATVAKQFGLNINETVTALALFANNGIKGSDAGTSLKTMLISLAKPSKEAAKLMKEIGFNAYDTEGNFVGLEKMSGRLKESLKGMTKEQKQSALATIFGTDAFRAAAVLSDNAGKSYDKMSTSVGKVGAAQQAAAAQLGAAEKTWEALSNTMSEIGLRIGMAVLPGLTSIGMAINSNALPAFNALGLAVSGQVPMFTMLGVAIGSYIVITRTATIGTRALAIAQGALNVAMKANPYVLVASAAIGIITAYAGVLSQTNQNKNATDRLNAARRAQVTASDSARAAEDRLRGAHHNQRGAALAVERAQRAYTEAVRQYGPKSLEAREAAHQLKDAQYNLRDANNSVKSSADNARTAQKRLADSKEYVKTALAQMGAAASGAAGGFDRMADSARAAHDAAIKGDRAGRDKAWNKGVTLPQFGKRYKGGSVSANKPYFVGENRDGSLNRTSELFVPKTSGHIVNSSDLQQALSQPSDSGGQAVQVRGGSNHIGTVYISDQVDADRFLAKLNGDSAMYDRGMKPARGW